MLQESVQHNLENMAQRPWPPTVESFSAKERHYPKLLESFFKELLSNKTSHTMSERVGRLTYSFCQDIVHAMSKGKFRTPKHISLGLGRHSLTGQKLPITVLARFGHSITYDTVNEIETAQAELVEHFRSSSLSLPLHHLHRPPR